MPDAKTCRNILRYEMRLDRQITRAYSLLLHLQARRKESFVSDLRSGKTKGFETNPFPRNDNEGNLLQEILKD